MAEAAVKTEEENVGIAGLLPARPIHRASLSAPASTRILKKPPRAIEASGAEIVTVAVRRVNVTNPNEPMLVDYVDPKKYTYLPNTAGCFTGDEAVRTLRLAREAGGWDLVKLEVLGDRKTLYPDMIETLNAAELLIQGRLQGHGLLLGRCPARQAPGRDGLRGDHAVGRAHRLGPWHSNADQHSPHHRAVQCPCPGGCRGRHRPRMRLWQWSSAATES